MSRSFPSHSTAHLKGETNEGTRHLFGSRNWLSHSVFLEAGPWGLVPLKGVVGVMNRKDTCLVIGIGIISFVTGFGIGTFLLNL